MSNLLYKFKVISLCLLLVFPAGLRAENQDKELVVLLHGIARSSKHMAKLEGYLQDRGYVVLNVDYPSTDFELDYLADFIYGKVKGEIEGNSKVHFVGYSMGGLLVRVILEKYRFDNLGKVVQLASPNHGSEVADFFQNNWLFKSFYGPAGQQLITNQGDIKDLFGEIYYELGVVAGNNTIDPVSSFIIKGDDDGKVSIESTKIVGMKDHVVVGASHIFFPKDKDVHKQVLCFLKAGKFCHKR